MKRSNRILLWCCLASLYMRAYAADPVRERAYLQTDKHLYLAGELLWMKMITTDADGYPMNLSKVGYVEIWNETAAVLQAKLEIIDGAGEGSFALPPNLPTGNYRVVAYTRYMQNEGEAVYFERLLPIVNTFMEETSVGTAGLLPATEALPAPASPVSVKADRASYMRRATGDIRLDNLPEDVHTLSISIAGKEFIPENRQTIADWTGKARNTPAAVLHTGILPEYEGHILNGRLVELASGQPATGVNAETLVGFVGDELRIFNGKVDQQANVSFFTKRISGTQEIATTVLSLSSAQRYRVDIQSPFVAKAKKIQPLRLSREWNDQLNDRSVALQVMQAYREDSINRTGRAEPFVRWEPSWQYLLDEYTRFASVEETAIEFIAGYRFRKGDEIRLIALTEERVGYSDNALVVLDGIPLIDHSLIYNYNPALLGKIEVYKGKYDFGNVGFNGIVFFKTFKNDFPGLKLSNATQLFSYEGTQAPRIFHMPSYNTDGERRSRLPDTRHTLLWNARVPVTGTTMAIPFTTSDLTGDFTVTVEGLTSAGTPIHAHTSFRVE